MQNTMRKVPRAHMKKLLLLFLQKTFSEDRKKDGGAVPVTLVHNMYV